jgi:phosphoenolpyruvate carboxykinase (GTP)
VGAHLQTVDAQVPAIFCVNWFRKGDNGKFVWPGYGENMRVLKWMIDRLEGKATGTETMFGTSPTYSEINWTGLNFSEAQFNSVTSIDKAAWQVELGLHTEQFAQLAYHLPKELEETKARLQERLIAA